MEGMLNYYKANYPRSRDAKAKAERSRRTERSRRVKCPVLLIHGLKDQALLPGGLNDTWNWIDATSPW